MKITKIIFTFIKMKIFLIGGVYPNWLHTVFNDQLVQCYYVVSQSKLYTAAY